MDINLQANCGKLTETLDVKYNGKMSFAFDVEKDGDEWDEGDGGIKRRINKFRKIYDVSVVDTPFYDTTNVFARSVELLESSAVGASAVALALEKRKLKMKCETKII